MLSASNLDLQQGLVKIIMKANCDVACNQPLNINPVIKLWHKLSQSQHLCKLISKYFILVEIGCCIALDSIENGHCFLF